MGVSVQRAVPADMVLAGPAVVTRRVYWDVTKTRLLAEGHPDARFLAYAEGTAVPAELVVEPAVVGGPASVAEVPVEPAPATRRTRQRADRQLAPGVVADTSIDGEAHTLVPEPGSPLRNGADK